MKKFSLLILSIINAVATAVCIATSPIVLYRHTIIQWVRLTDIRLNGLL